MGIDPFIDVWALAYLLRDRLVKPFAIFLDLLLNLLENIPDDAADVGARRKHESESQGLALALLW